MTIINQEVRCQDAREFLDALNPIGHIFQDSLPGAPWLFRGQGQDWPLVPSLFRQVIGTANVPAYEDCLLNLRNHLAQFFEIADRRGLMLPDDSQKLRTIIETVNSEWGDSQIRGNSSGFEALGELLSLEALAQHHGIPTRLIDWTRNPFIAAFFAGEDVLLNSYDEKSLFVVWAFYFPVLGKHYEISRLTDPVQVVTAPSATNANLKAQQGVFTLSNYTDDRNENGAYVPLEQMLDDLARKADPERSARGQLIVKCKLQKFTLPVSEATQLMYLLAKLDIIPSAVYPGFQSIRRDIQMRKEWELSESLAIKIAK